MTKDLFHSATLRLTAWYMAILIVLSLLFSLIVYSIASHEFERAIGPRRNGEAPLFIQSDIVDRLRQERIEDSNHHLLANLFFFNIVTLAVGGGASYLLARRTLRPIEDALEAQTRFSSDAAHELRTPLAIMQSEIEVDLRDKKATKESHAATLKSNLDEVDRLRTLTDRLLLLASNHDMALAPTPLEDVAIDAVTRHIPLAQAKNITIENTVGALSVIANQESLADVIGVLLDNAIKYSPEKSTIRLYAEARDKLALISVADEGPGLSAEETAKVFERFYRADSARSSLHVEGHGLGLSIAKRLIEQQHGTIAVASEPGKGSVFTLRIPLAP